MRIAIKGADFSAVSIGKVTRDLSFELCGNTVDGISSDFLNWDEDEQTVHNVHTYQIVEGVVSLTSSYGERLQSDYIEVCEGMTVTFGNVTDANASNGIRALLVCFDENKNLLTTAATYAAWRDLGGSTINNSPFVIPSGVKYIILQCQKTTTTNKNIFTGTMPV